MSFSFESIVVLLLFLIPGFVTHSVQRYFQAKSPPLSTFEISLISLGNSALILLIQILLFSIISLIIPLVDINVLAATGVIGYFQTDPSRTVFQLWVWLFLSLVIGSILGYMDPLGRFLARQLSQRNLSEEDVWTSVFVLRRKELNKEWCYLSIVLRNGDIYRGLLIDNQLDVEEDGSRVISLASVTYLPNGDGSKAVQAGAKGQTLVVLNSKDILSIEVIYLNSEEGIPAGSWTR